MTADEKRAYYKARYLSDPERFRDAARKRHHRNRDYILRRNREQRTADPRRMMLNSARARAKLSGLEFRLTVEDIEVPEVCPVLGIPIILGLDKKHDASPSLDRIDSSKGYTPDNVAVISDRANRIKNNGTSEEHELIARWMQERGA